MNNSDNHAKRTPNPTFETARFKPPPFGWKNPHHIRWWTRMLVPAYGVAQFSWGYTDKS